MTQNHKRGQGALEYLLLIGGSVVVAVIVIFIVMGLAPAAGNQAQTGLESYREAVGVKVTGNPTVAGGSLHMVGSEVTFSANPSKGTPPYTCDWIFGDGTMLEDDACQISHTYTSPYSGDVTVTITDSQNEQATKSVQVVVAAPTQAVITAPTEVNLARGASVTLSCADSTVKDPPAICAWSVAPTTATLSAETGESVTLQVPPTVDFYTVSLTLTDSAGTESADSQEIEAFFLETFDSADALNNLPNRNAECTAAMVTAGVCTGLWVTGLGTWEVDSGALKNTNTWSNWERIMSSIAAPKPYVIMADFKTSAAGTWFALIPSQASAAATSNSYLLFGLPTQTLIYEWGGSNKLLQITMSPVWPINNWHSAKFARTQMDVLKAFFKPSGGTWAPLCGDNCLTPAGGTCGTTPPVENDCQFTDSTTPRTGNLFGIGRKGPAAITYFDNLEVRKCRELDCSDRLP